MAPFYTKTPTNLYKALVTLGCSKASAKERIQIAWDKLSEELEEPTEEQILR